MSESIDKEISEFFSNLASEQRPLGADFARVLSDSLLDLYEGKKVSESCEWVDDPRRYRFKTGCGQVFICETGGAESEFKFCPYCGKPLQSNEKK